MLQGELATTLGIKNAKDLTRKLENESRWLGLQKPGPTILKRTIYLWYNLYNLWKREVFFRGETHKVPTKVIDAVNLKLIVWKR